MNRKHQLAAAGIGLVAIASLAGCAGTTSSAPSDGSGVEITYLTHWGPEQTAQLEAAAAAFTAENPDVTIKVQSVPFDQLLSTLATQGSGPDGPTITNIYTAWLPQLASDGIVGPAPADVAADVTANYGAGFAAAASTEGSVYGVPNEVALYQLNYNTELFQAAGISEAPADWDALIADATALKGAGVKNPYGFITAWGNGVVHPFLSLLASNGGSFLNADGTASALTSPEALEVARLYEELVDKGLTDISLSTADANTTGPYLDSFSQNLTGMIVMANWWKGTLESAMGDGFSDIASAPIPVGPSGDVSSSISYTWANVVSSKADEAKQKAAWEFLTYLNGPDSGAAGSSAMGDILIGMGILPSRTSDLDAHAAELNTPFLTSYVEAQATATPFPTVNGVAEATTALQTELEALLNGQKDAATAMKDADAAVNAALSAAR
ncbi:MAG: extracellular solute-binding protein [Microbacterium sp.]|uniref:ABC transporter substrate-binding protein n=1 Tax=Microbacterium sp. TaxID=51671 RepID=UPI001AD05B40|nr:extracellular solute-binding protein [Microbacterium sp.]MBN9177491.1 extracellular solute-binding protein [Microbacterium sp.]